MDVKGFMKKKVWGVQVMYIIIGVVILGIVAIIISAKIKKNKKMIAECKKRKGTWDKKQKKCIVKPKPSPSDDSQTSTEGSYDPSGQSGTGIQWTPNTIASEVATAYEGYNFWLSYRVANKVLALTDDQLRVLYKYYNKRHAKDYPTITKLFENEWDDYYFSKSPFDKVADRFKGLGLY